MNKNVLKQIALISLFLGAILGVITVIPYIGELAFWTQCLCSSGDAHGQWRYQIAFAF